MTRFAMLYGRLETWAEQSAWRMIVAALAIAVPLGVAMKVGAIATLNALGLW